MKNSISIIKGKYMKNKYKGKALKYLKRQLYFVLN